MFVPIPVLVAIGAILLLLLAPVLRRSRRRDPLLGAQQSAYRPAPPRDRPQATAPERAPIGEGETTLAPEVEAQVIALISAGRKIEAIKVVKDATRMGLKDSKDLVEALERG
ncbi:MAG: ribosomal protein L7/L12 [Sphingomonas sp.]